MAPKTLILIRLSKWVRASIIVKIIEFPFQELFMGRNWNSLPKSLFYPLDPQILNKKKKKRWILGILEHFSRHISSLFLSKFSPKHIQKHFISLFSQQSRGCVLVLFFLSLVLGP